MSNFLELTLILTGSILLLGLLAILFRKQKKPASRDRGDSRVSSTFIDNTCCGAHDVCERESLLSAANLNIEYYDDEELDRYRGKSGNAYSDEEISEFREIFYTLQETDIAGWVRSLQLREIALPDSLKDEIILIIGERRLKNQ